MTITRAFFLLPAVFMIGCSAPEPYTDWKSIEITSGEQIWRAFIADTVVKREQGLTGVLHLPSSHAVLFSLKQPHSSEVWMRGTLIPLDVIWLDADKNVVSVQTLQPCSDSQQCLRIGVKSPVAFIVEMNAGTYRGQRGDKFTLANEIGRP